MADNIENGLPPIPEQGTGEQDLFSGGQTVAPPPGENKEEKILPPPIPVPRQEADRSVPPDPLSAVPENAPHTTNAPNGTAKPPLVFSDGDPLPRRGGETREPVSAKTKSALPKRRAVHLDPSAFKPDCGFGDYLKAARTEAGYTLEQVEAVTKLRSHYLTALEKSDLKHLPPMVYVLAYIRSLKELYGLDDDGMSMIREKLHQTPDKSSVPPTLIQNLERDSLINEEENERIRHIFWAAAAGLGLLFVLIVWLIAAALMKPSVPEQTEKVPAEEKETVPESVSPSGKPEFRMEDFDALTAPQVLEPSTLQMDKKPSLMQ